MNVFLTSLFFLQVPQQMDKKEALTQTKEMQALTEMMHPSRSIIIIDPKERANDYLKAWELLKQEKSTTKVFFALANGAKIANVIDMKLLPGNTLIFFRYSTPQGLRYQVVEIEDILGIQNQ